LHNQPTIQKVSYCECIVLHTKFVFYFTLKLDFAYQNMAFNNNNVNPYL